MDRLRAVRGSMRGLVAVALLSTCSVYDESLLETRPGPAGSTTSDGGTGGSSSSEGSGGSTTGMSTSSGGVSGSPSSTESTTSDGGTGGTGGGTTDVSVGGSGGSGGTGAAATGGTGGDGGGTGGTGATGGTGGSGGTCTTSCNDACPDDPDKTEPGICGCGIPDTGAASCAGLIDNLIHRYSFEGSGSTVSDSVGNADGTAVLASLDGSGAISLAGTDSGEYVDLPAGLASSLQVATFEVWFTWDGNGDWERVFDFGNPLVDTPEYGDTYLFLTPRSGDSYLLQATFSSGDGLANETVLLAADAAAVGGETHAAIVVESNTSFRLYVNGALEGSTTLTHSLADLVDDNCWFGRSQYAQDPGFGGSLEEFRIYSTALSAQQIALSYASGPDPDFLP